MTVPLESRVEVTDPTGRHTFVANMSLQAAGYVYAEHLGYRVRPVVGYPAAEGFVITDRRVFAGQEAT